MFVGEKQYRSNSYFVQFKNFGNGVQHSGNVAAEPQRVIKVYVRGLGARVYAYLRLWLKVTRKHGQ